MGFRYYARQMAEELGLTGFVANRPDRTLLVVAEGDKEALDMLLDTLKTGPPRAVISQVTVSRSPWTGDYPSFVVRY